MREGCGVHHCNIGVRDLEATKAFYRDTLDFTNIFVEFPEAEYPALREVVRIANPVYSAVLFSQEAGGIIVELCQMINPTPRPIRSDFRYGDIGVNKMSIAVSDLDKVYNELKNKMIFCSAPKSVKIKGWGDYRLVYGRDSEGNLIEFFCAEKMRMTDKFGGVQWMGVSVTELERSIEFYQKYMGFDRMFINPHESFSGILDEVTGVSNTKLRSCVLENSKAEGMVELFEMTRPRGRSVPHSTIWGDFGYWQICVNGDNNESIFEIAAYFENEGLEFISKPQLMKDEKRGGFFYLKDPDGIHMEFLVFNQ